MTPKPRLGARRESVGQRSQFFGGGRGLISWPNCVYEQLMNAQTRYRLCSVLALMLLAGLSGCAKTKSAKLKTWRAAELDVTGIERLAVLGFRGKDDVAALTKQSTLQRLTSSRFYHVLQDRGQYAACEVPLPTKYRGLQQIVNWGRRLRADAVLVGQAQRELDLGTQVGEFNLRVGDPKLAVAIEYYVVDVHTGSIRGRGRIAGRKTEEEFARHGGMAEHTADHFVDQCVQEMVTRLTAGSGTTQVELARMSFGKASLHIDHGNDAAAEGNWSKAMKLYESALEADPGSHEAFYNLGIAHEAQGRFAKAKQLYAKAMETSDDPLYGEALARAEKTGATYQLACRQLHHRPRGTLMPNRTVHHHGLARQTNHRR